jgi:hypothetical protein
MAEMTQDDFARSIGMTPLTFAALLDMRFEQRNRLDYTRRTLRQQYNHVLTNAQLAAAKQWFKDHPQD